MSDRTRVRLYRLLLDAKKEIAVCELIDAVQESQYNVSRHLQVLKTAGLAKENRRGRWILYSVADNDGPDVSGVVMSMDEKAFKEDRARLKKRLSLRNGDEIVSCTLARELMETTKGGSDK